jgi:argininosuccinate lyase
VASASNTLEKALWDLNLYSTEEFGFVGLPDAFTTGSSLLPQKRNPDALELARSRCRELRGLQGLLSHLSGGLPSSYHRDHQALKAPFLELLDKGGELFRVCAHLLPGLEISREACGAACTPELHAAQEACRLAAKGMPFRDAYRQVAQRLKEGSFSPHPAPSGESLDLDAREADLCQVRAWLSALRDHLDSTTRQLFAWGTP